MFIRKEVLLKHFINEGRIFKRRMTFHFVFLMILIWSLWQIFENYPRILLQYRILLCLLFLKSYFQIFSQWASILFPKHKFYFWQRTFYLLFHWPSLHFEKWDLSLIPSDVTKSLFLVHQKDLLNGIAQQVFFGWISSALALSTRIY